MIITDDVVDRFWAKVDRRGPDDCWEWQAAERSKGYGAFKVGGHAELAHRVIWTITNGSIPNSLFVCHHCDNPGCVNPKHLFIGSHSDNMRDAYYKGRIKMPANSVSFRYGKGENNPNSKLTDADVLDIRRLYADGGVTYRSLSEYYGVDHTLIYQVVRRKRWTHI